MPTKKDPTRTTVLRRSFMKDMRKRFRAVRRSVVELIVDLDALGLEESQPFSFENLAAGVERQAWRFQNNDQKLASFKRWLKRQVDAEILTVDVKGQPWTATYIDSAYKKGSIRAFVDARKEASDAGAEFFEGSKEEFIRSSFAQPERLDKVKLLATRAFEELEGVTATMGQQLNRALANGLVNGSSPREIARVMTRNIDTLTRGRALTIARTEVIHAHAEGQLDSFQELGIEEVGILAEWSTTGDERVCPQCSAMEEQTLTIKEARGMIPRHPNCRCAWIPSTVAERRNRRKKLLAAIDKSIKAERPKATAGAARAASQWIGKEQ